MSNFARTLWLGLTRGHGVSVPGRRRQARRYFQQLTRMSSAYALMADVAMLLLGGSLKRRERMSARLGDILSQMYLASAALKRFEDNGEPEDELPLLQWSVRDAFCRIDAAFVELLENLPFRFISTFLPYIIFPYGREFNPPRDTLSRKVVKLLMEPNAARERLTSGIYVPRDENDAVSTLEAALRAVIAAEPVEARLRAAQKAGAIAGRFHAELVKDALGKQVISQAEADVLERARSLRRKAIMVDDFPRDLGPSEITQSTQPVTFEALARA
jgi:acyl-CoA dehydrogenase